MADALYPDSSVTPNPVVDFSVATEVVEGQVRKLTIWLKSVEVLTDAVAFVQTNNLLSEIWVKAGLVPDDTFTLLTLSSSSTESYYHVYELVLQPATT